MPAGGENRTGKFLLFTARNGTTRGRRDFRSARDTGSHRKNSFPPTRTSAPQCAEGCDGLLPGGCRNDVFCLPGLKVVVRLNNLRASVCHAVHARLLSTGRNKGLPVANYGHCASWNAFQFVERSTIDDVKLVCAAQRIVAQILGDLIQA